MTVSAALLDEMRAAFSGRTAESGGILGMRGGVVCRFAFDGGEASKVEYLPNTDRLNAVIGEWRGEGISFCGMVHTHLGGCTALSDADIESIRAIASAVQRECLYFPIVTFEGERLCLTVYRASDGEVLQDELITL